MDALNYVVNLKRKFIQLQKFEVCYYLRGIENKFNGEFKEKRIEVNYDNLINCIVDIINTQTMLDESKVSLFSILRDIKIRKLINEF